MFKVRVSHKTLYQAELKALFEATPTLRDISFVVFKLLCNRFAA